MGVGYFGTPPPADVYFRHARPADRFTEPRPSGLQTTDREADAIGQDLLVGAYGPGSRITGDQVVRAVLAWAAVRAGRNQGPVLNPE